MIKLFLLITVVSVQLFSQPFSPDYIIQEMRKVQDSHINANVPAPKDFDRILTFSLKGYFKEKFPTMKTLSYEMLRKRPTQSGVALPKFYVWVTLKNKDQIISSGAVKLAAIEKRAFSVYNFISSSEIKQKPQSIYKVFPRILCEKILKK